jgi:endonuclease/exonuclease/phosphatase family metal-dependent hydrolase
VPFFYRPPNSHSSIFDTLFSYLDSINVRTRNNFVLLGDFNVNFDNPYHPMFCHLCTITNLYCLNQSVAEPTHVHHDGSESTIDLVFVSDPSLLNSCVTVPRLSNSDHTGIIVELSQKLIKANKKSGATNLALRIRRLGQSM